MGKCQKKENISYICTYEAEWQEGDMAGRLSVDVHHGADGTDGGDGGGASGGPSCGYEQPYVCAEGEGEQDPV